MPDPQFGLDGTIIGGAAAFAAIDIMSAEFLDAAEACQDILAALQPELEPLELAERNEELLRFAECMRREGIDFPDPDPIRGLTVASFRGEDGRLTIDAFSPAFLQASAVCRTEVGLALLPRPEPLTWLGHQPRSAAGITRRLHDWPTRLMRPPEHGRSRHVRPQRGMSTEGPMPRPQPERRVLSSAMLARLSASGPWRGSLCAGGHARGAGRVRRTECSRWRVRRGDT